MIDKIKEIIQSYAIALNPTEEQRKIAEIRLLTCIRCEHWDKTVGIEYCKLCGCATKGKIFTPKGLEACPEKKWKI